MTGHSRTVWMGLALLLIPWGPLGGELYGWTQAQRPDAAPVAFLLLHWVLPLGLATGAAVVGFIGCAKARRPWLAVPVGFLWLGQIWLVWLAAAVRTGG